jgi:CubicO group peptidase (beta-lactamase class C family)
MKGPQAVGVSPDAPKDPIGIMLGWTPEQTLVNFKHLDQLFSVRTVPHGASTLELSNDEPIDPIVPLEGQRLTVDQLMDEYRVTGVIALHHGRIVLERYAHGRTARDRWFSASVAKSFTSTLIGAAIRDGLIGSIDDPLTGYIPELKSAPAFDGVTLRHLMTMSSGLRFNENTTDPTSDMALTDGGEVINGRPPIVTYAMKLTRAHPPGTVEEYQTIDIDLLGIALSRALKGRTVSDYLSEKVWRPAGMEADANWVTRQGGNRTRRLLHLSDPAGLCAFWPVHRERRSRAGGHRAAGWLDRCSPQACLARHRRWVWLWLVLVGAPGRWLRGRGRLWPVGDHLSQGRRGDRGQRRFARSAWVRPRSLEAVGGTRRCRGRAARSE